MSNQIPQVYLRRRKPPSGRQPHLCGHGHRRSQSLHHEASRGRHSRVEDQKRLCILVLWRCQVSDPSLHLGTCERLARGQTRGGWTASTLISRTIRSSVYAPVGAVGIPTVGPLSGPMESAGGRPAGHEPIMSQRYLLAEPTVLIGLSTPKPCTCIGVTSSRRYRSYVIVRVRTTVWLSLCERAPRDRSQSRCTCGASGVSSTPVERLEAASTWYRRVPRLASPERAPVGCLARTGGPGAARPTHTERMSAGLHVYG